MSAATILPDPQVLKIEKIISEANVMTIVARSFQATSCCPTCQHPARRVQSRYQRRVQDLPWQGVAVRLRLTVRRFYCETEECPQRIFVERLPTVVAPYGRRASRLEALIHQFGVAAGGNPGVRLLAAMPVEISRQSVLRRLNALPLGPVSSVRVLGVDDFAFRRGQHYGTILVDQERRAVVDLLPDREAESLAVWLKAHPEVEIITRDRAPAYAAGAKQGAPQATQIADRFHLVLNAGQVLERILEREPKALRQAAAQVRGRQVADAVPVPEVGSEPMLTALQAANRQRREEREAARRERFEQVRTLAQQGVPIHRIAAQCKMHRRDVRRFMRADTYPERAAPSKRGSQLDRHLPHLQHRWEEGCHNAAALFREIKAGGYRGSQSALRSLIGRWKAGLPPELRARSPINFKVAQTLFTQPSVRRTVWLALDPRIEKTEAETWFLAELRAQSAVFQTAVELVIRFQTLVKERQPDHLSPWLTEAETGDIPELKTFGAGLRQDLAAVTAALTHEWSNGRVEGTVNRLKLIKRSMYGRANFSLLRARTIQPEKN